MKFKKLVSTIGIGLGMAAAAGPGVAVEKWSFQDDDIEFVLTSDPDKAHPGFAGMDFDGTTYYIKDYTDAALSVENGDLFVAIFEFSDANRLTFPGNSWISSLIPPGQELTGILVAEATAASGGLTFTPFSKGLNSIIGAAGGNVIDVADDPGYSGYADAGGGALLGAWLNSTADFDLDLNASTNPQTNCSSLLDCVSKAATGSLFQVDGFTGDPDEEWTYLGETNLNTVKNAGDTTSLGLYNLKLGNFYNVENPVLLQNASTGLPDPSCGDPGDADGCVQVVGSGNVLGGNSLVNGALAHSDIDAQKYIPEPATLALFGAGLLGLGVRRRKLGS